MHVNARAIIERETAAGVEIVLQVRNKPHEGGKWLELPGGRVEEFESLVEALKREVHEETGLVLTYVEGQDTRVETLAGNTNVECLRPFAAYQTTKGPVDSMGIYFRCRGEGELRDVGDDAERPQWVPVRRIAERMAQEPDTFSWVDCAGLLFYLKQVP